MPDQPAFSRPTESACSGKCDQRIDVLVPESVKDRAARVARLRGHPSLGSWARVVIEAALMRDENEIDAIVRQTGGDLHWRNRP